MSTNRLNNGPERDVEVNRRDRIAAAARFEFARFGYAGARVQRVADRAGVNKQLIYYYFESKAGLYRMVMEESSRFLAAQSAEADARATLHLSLELRSAYAALQDNPHLVRMILYDARDGGIARELADSIISKLHLRLAGIVSRGQGLGYFRDDADPDTIARQAVGLILGQLCLEVALFKPTEPASPDPAACICELLLRLLEW